MGVESKFYFVKDYEFGYGFPNRKGKTESEIIAMIDVGKFGYDEQALKLKELFKTEIPFVLYKDTQDEEGNEIMGYEDESPYGNKLCYGEYEELIPQLQEVIKFYRKNGWSVDRLKPLLSMMKDFSKAKYEKVYCVLYDY